MSAGDFAGHVDIEGGRVTVREHTVDVGGRTLYVLAGAVTVMVNLDGDQAAALARLLVEPAP